MERRPNPRGDRRGRDRPLIDLMQQADDEVRPLAAMALAEIGAAGIDPLIRMLDNPDLRSTVAEALVRIGEPWLSLHPVPEHSRWRDRICAP